MFYAKCLEVESAIAECGGLENGGCQQMQLLLYNRRGKIFEQILRHRGRRVYNVTGLLERVMLYREGGKYA